MVPTQTSEDDRERARAATVARRRRLVEQVGSGEGGVHELARQLRVSASTVRRDLAALARDGRIVRTYGGAVHTTRATEPTARAKELSRRQQKDAIAAAAAQLVHPGDLVVLDAGSTVARLARLLAARHDITVVTNGVATLLDLADARVDVMVLGGRLRRPNQSLLGGETERALARLTPDLAFVGADGVDPRRGVNCPDPDQASVKELMAAGARRAVVLADHSKIRTPDPYRYWAPVPAATELITDTASDPAVLDRFIKAGWSLSLAGDPAPSPAANGANS